MFQKAVKKKSKLRLAICGASGSGKTYSALILANAMSKSKRIAVIDTEHGSASLYSDKFNFDVLELKAPYEPEKYIEAIKAAENAGYDVCVIDSISHEWNSEGGCIDISNKVAESSRSGNSYVAWAKVTPRHDRFIQTMLASNMHIIATMRSKSHYESTKSDNGKLKYEKKGMAPIQRETTEYEFTIVFDLNQNHFCSASKDRSGLFDGKDFIIAEETGKQLINWLDNGEDTAIIKLKTRLFNLSGGDLLKQEQILLDATKSDKYPNGYLSTLENITEALAARVLQKLDAMGNEEVPL